VKRNYTEYDEILRRGMLKFHDPSIAHLSVVAFDALTDDRKGFVKVSEWEERMKGLGIELRDENGIPVEGYMAYTHRFSLKLIDGEPCIGDPELEDEDE